MVKLCAHLFVFLSICVSSVHAADTSQIPQNPADFFYGDGVRAYFSGDADLALRSLTTAIEHGSDPRWYYFRGLAYLRKGQRSLAELDFARGARLELQRIDRYRLLVDESERLSEVNRALERIQGEPRRILEKQRLRVYPTVREAQIAKHIEIERIRAAMITAARERALELRSFQDLVGMVLEIRGVRLRVLVVQEYQRGIQSLAVIPADVSLDPTGYANTFVNTGNGFVTGKDALNYDVAKKTRRLSAADISELKLDAPKLHLVYNPLHGILSSPEEAREGWRQFQINEEARRQREAQLAREQQERIEEQRRQDAIRFAQQSERDEFERIERQRIAAVRADPFYFDENAKGKAIWDLFLAWLGHVGKKGWGRGDLEWTGWGWVDTGLNAIASEGSGRFRDGRIGAAIRGVFPNLDDRTVGFIENVASRYIDGELTLENLVRDQVEQEFKDQLNQQDPGLGDVYAVVKFLADVHDKCQRN